jgi:hypothetical protein
VAAHFAGLLNTKTAARGPRVASIDEHRAVGPELVATPTDDFADEFSTGRMWKSEVRKGRAERLFFGHCVTLPRPPFHTCGERCGTHAIPCKTAVF